MPKNQESALSRREFVAGAAAGTAASLAAPYVLADSKTSARPLILGEGEHRFEVIHDWPQLPDKFHWQTTHNVAVDKDGFVYVMHEGRANLKDHPSIFVFDPDGKYVRSFGSEYQGGGHGLEVRQEGGEQFIYACGYQQVKMFSKMTLDGEVVWRRYAPMDSGVYAKNEDTDRKKIWGRDRFLPTNFAFLPDGDFYLADGYGSYTVHRYDKNGNWKSFFGGPGKGEGKFNTPHGIWVDNRPGRKPQIAICDRAHHTLQYLDLDGSYVETLSGYGLPANADTWKNLLVVPELHARVTLLGDDNQVVARLGADVERIKSDRSIRNSSDKWLAGRFVHPHDACFGTDGSIFVAEWVGTGRVTKLKRLS